MFIDTCCVHTTSKLASGKGRSSASRDPEIDRVAEPDPCVQITRDVDELRCEVDARDLAPVLRGEESCRPTDAAPDVEHLVGRGDRGRLGERRARDATERVELLDRCDRGRIEIVGIVAGGAQRIEDRSAETA